MDTIHNGTSPSGGWRLIARGIVSAKSHYPLDVPSAGRHLIRYQATDGHPVPVRGTTNVQGKPRPTELNNGQPGSVVMTVRVGAKPVSVVIPLSSLLTALGELGVQFSAQQKIYLPNETT